MNFIHKILMLQHHVTLNSIISRVIFILVILSLGHSIQINDVVLSKSSSQISSSNVTRLKSNSSEVNSDEKNIFQINLDDKVNKYKKVSDHKKSSIFTPWSSWSDCDRRCKQKRTRKCIKRRKCGSVKQTEERICEEYLCQRNSNSNSNHKNRYKKRNKNIELDQFDPYIADDEYDTNDFNDDDVRLKRHEIENSNRIVMKVVKQGDYQYKQFDHRKSGGRGLGDIQQSFFLPVNLTFYNSQISHKNSIKLKSGFSAYNNNEDYIDADYSDMADNSNNNFNANNDEFDEETDMKAGVERGKIKAVFEVPRKPVSNYSKWSRWSKCSPKCITKRYKKCRPHARQICSNDIIREVAYCYTEGSFCEEWISTQITKLNGVETTTRVTTTVPTTTIRSPRASRRTESPLSNSISNFYGPGKRKNKTSLSDNRAQNFQCGFPSIRNKNSDFTLKIIGGKVARRGAWPWQVAILNRYKEAFCGGTLISPNWVLTASHCVRKRLYVILGEHNLNVKEGSEIEFKIQTSIKHPKYNKKTVDSDIALLKLPQSVERSHFIGFACLPEKSQQLPVGQSCKVIGWGKRKHSDESGTALLHEAEVPIISNDACRNVYYDYVITKNMFCAGSHRRDTCSGDSGGPILCRDPKRTNKPWTIYGITSFGDGCGKKNKFGIYTKITNYVDFIWSIVNCNGLCENNNTF
ncbi:hypothetical protein ACKWTF_008233 [Chironomus riparius]